TPSIPGASAAGIPISLASAAPPAGEQLAVAVAAGAEDEVLDPLLPGLDAAGDRGRDADRVQLRQLDHVAVEVDPAAAPDHHVDLLGVLVPVAEGLAAVGLHAVEAEAGL